MSSSSASRPFSEGIYKLDNYRENGAVASDPRPAFQDVKYHTSQDEPAVYNGPSTPYSNYMTDGMRTRSGRSAGGTESPLGMNNFRSSKSPASKPKRERKGRGEKPKTPKLTAALSVLTKDMNVPLKDIDAWVHRSIEERKKEVEKRNGYITRPMNSFMLYRSAYAERTKQWCLQNNHQVVSSVSGESWPQEAQEVRDQFEEWAKIERANHQAAHPLYKFSPSKSATKRRKDEISDDDQEASDLEHDPDGEYRGPKNNRRRNRDRKEVTFQPISTSNNFESQPYYNHLGVDLARWGYQAVGPDGQPHPSEVAYTSSFNDPRQMPEYLPPNAFHTPVYETATHEAAVALRAAGSPSPLSHDLTQSLGGYGLPGGHGPSDEILFPSSGRSTPMQTFGQQPSSTSIVNRHHHHHYLPQARQVYIGVPAASLDNAYEHQRYLQRASEPRTEIDPALETAVRVGRDRFYSIGEGEDAAVDSLVDFGASSSHGTVPRSPSDVNATLAPTWMSEEL